MNLRTRLSRSNGYRELGMFDESILELEAIEFGEDRGIATTYHSGCDQLALLSLLSYWTLRGIRPIGAIGAIVLLSFEEN